MSTATVTPLVKGDPATSTAINTTITSFNTAMNTSQIAASNVRMEGIDRRAMSGAGHVVETQESGTNTIKNTANSGAVNNPTALYVVVPGFGGDTLVTNTFTVAASSRMPLHASVWVTSNSANSGAVRLRVDLILQQSVDAGVTWTDITGTRRRCQMRETGALCSAAANPKIPGLNHSITWSVYVATIGVGTSYRVGYKTVNDSSTGGQDPTFENGTIFVETFGK